MSSNPMDREIARLLAEGQGAARRGDRAMARTLLTQLVDQDPHNEEAWMWLSAVVSDPSEQQICLENVLVINPYNAQARRGLDFLVQKTGVPSRVSQVPPQPQASTQPEAPVEAQPPQYVEPAASQAQPQAAAPEEPSFPPTPAWAQPAPDSTAFMAEPGAQQSWAVPGPEPADPFKATIPYAPIPDGADAPVSGNDTGSAAASDIASTVPYTAPPPSHSDVPFSAAGAVDMNGAYNSGGLNGSASANGNGNGNGHGKSNGNDNGKSATPQFDFNMDGQPFVPSGRDSQQTESGFRPFNGKLGSPEDTATDLPAWLEGLTPSVPADHSGSGDSPFVPFDISNFASPTGMTSMNLGNMSPMGNVPDPNMPFGAPTGAPPDLGHMSPFSDLRLPSPHELPGEDGRSGSGSASASSQPWYLQGSGNTMAPPMPTGGVSSYLDSAMLSSSMLGPGSAGAALLEDQRTNKSGATLECPNCKEHVPDTSLACPNCRYNFFVNCPHCHELVDTADAVPGKVDECPYCKGAVNKMELGLGGVADLVSQKNPGSRPAAAASMIVAFPSMEQSIPGLKTPRRGLSFNWVVDLLWLIAVVMMVWALTQLPTWLNLSGMY